MNRRDFFDPRGLAHAAGSLLDGAADPAANTASGEAVQLRFARRAMATTFEVILPFSTPDAHIHAETALAEIDRLEGQLTVYQESSELCRLNAQAHRQPVLVEKGLFDLLSLAQRLSLETGGAFDVATGALSKTWGFFRRQGRVPTQAERDDVRERIGSQHVTLDPHRQTVFFQRPGLEINLGSIGKGYALDRAAALLPDVANLLLHGGHSSIFARGREKESEPGWSIGILDPVRPERRRALVCLCNRGMATSAATYQHLEHEGRKLGHLLDPRTAWPAEGMLSATVTAPTAAEADALATAFFILGIEGAKAFCEGHPDIGAALIAAAEPHRVVVLGRAIREVRILAG